ncbi:MAG: twin-arginine translocase subunit TatB [Alphaproteobacteria bacterium]|nr:twin-arginine translocase subunit TatB [Alphaproteobacteria bacterium]
MFDLGWQEFMLIALVAVVVVGPKDLPRVVRAVGHWIRKARSLAGEFQSSFEEMARESELDDVRKQIQQVSRDGLSKTLESNIDPEGDLRRSVEQAKSASGVDEIENEMQGIHRETKAVASAESKTQAPGSAPAGPSAEPRDPVIETAEDYAAKYAAVKIPDNSIRPPAEDTPPPSAKKPAAKTTTAKTPATKTAATKATAAKQATAKKPATTKPSAAKRKPAKTAAAKTAAAKAKPAADGTPAAKG